VLDFILMIDAKRDFSSQARKPRRLLELLMLPRLRTLLAPALRVLFTLSKEGTPRRRVTLVEVGMVLFVWCGGGWWDDETEFVVV
jgi:hypothetical protein